MTTLNKTRLVEEATLHQQEVRCECGSLVAKLVGSAIELKCRRCKRLALIPFADFKGGSRTVAVRL